MCLSRRARALNQNGLEYTSDNMEGLLEQRHHNKKLLRVGKHLKGPAKRTKEQDEAFGETLERMLKTASIVSDDSRDDEVGMDDIVEVLFEEDNEVEKYKLVTSIRGNSMENRVSIESPIGKALRGHRVGDRVEVKVNDDYSYYLVIKSIDKTGSEDEEIRGF